MIQEEFAYYATIPVTILHDKNLKPISKLIYAQISALSRKEGYCYAKDSTLCEQLNISVVYLQEVLKELEHAKYIKRETSKTHEGTFRKIWLVPVPAIVDTPIPPKQIPVPAIVDTKLNNNINYNKVDYKIVTTLQSEPKALAPKEDKRNPDIQEVYEYGLSKGFVGVKQQYQRYAIKRLLGKIEKNKLLRLVDFTQQIRKDQFAPQVNTFLDMEYKLANLRDYMSRKQNKAKTIVKI